MKNRIYIIFNLITGFLQNEKAEAKSNVLPASINGEKYKVIQNIMQYFL